MREEVDLHVNVVGANAVEYKMTAPSRAARSWRVAAYALWLITVASASSWYSQPPQQQQTTWLHVAWISAALGYVLHVATGSTVVEESVLVVPSMGVQLTQHHRNGATHKRFLNASDISAVVVNEAFEFSDVVYYLAFMTHSHDTMVVAFEHFRPRIAVLQEVFVHMRRALFPDESAMRLPHLS